MTPRRYYLLARFHHERAGSTALGSIWRAKQEGEPGTELPAGFPARAKLVAVGYSALEDLSGADENELLTNAGLSVREMRAVLTALA